MNPAMLALLAARAAAPAGGGTLTFIGHGNDFSTTPIGTPGADRTVIVAVMDYVYHADAPFVTVGGSAATVDLAHYTYAEDYVPAFTIAHATVPSGATAAVNITRPGSIAKFASIAVWTWHGAVLSVAGTAVDLDGDATVNLAPASAAGGPVVAVITQGADWAVPVTWTGARKDFDGVWERQRSGASAIATGASTAMSATLGTTYAGVYAGAVAYTAA